MAKYEWSDETKRLRAVAGEALDQLARAAHNDRERWGYFSEWSDDEKESGKLEGKQPTAWLAVIQFQGFDDPEMSNVIYVHSGATGATNKGLAAYAFEAHR
jgi:hypothetical protein